MSGAAPTDGTDLAGRVALVTGGGRGLGPHFTAAPAAAGAAAAVAARTEAELRETARRIEAAGGRAAPHVTRRSWLRPHG